MVIITKLIAGGIDAVTSTSLTERGGGSVAAFEGANVCFCGAEGGSGAAGKLDGIERVGRVEIFGGFTMFGAPPISTK